jgi:hypothetical protein
VRALRAAKMCSPTRAGRHELNPQYMPLLYVWRLVTFSSVDFRVCVGPYTYCEIWAFPPPDISGHWVGSEIVSHGQQSQIS